MLELSSVPGLRAHSLRQWLDRHALWQIRQHYDVGLPELGFSPRYGHAETGSSRTVWSANGSDLVVVIDVWVTDPTPDNGERPEVNVNILLIDNQRPEVW